MFSYPSVGWVVVYWVYAICMVALWLCVRWLQFHGWLIVWKHGDSFWLYK
jgi:hypothetical protein